MRAVVQRVSKASVSVGGKVVGSCGPGLLVLVAVHRDDTESEAEKLAQKIATLRIFNDAEGKMNLDVSSLDSSLPQVLAISNFTVYGDAKKSRRPSFSEAASFDNGKILHEKFIDYLRRNDLIVETGEFGADMQVELVNDGPVTLIVEVEPK